MSSMLPISQDKIIHVNLREIVFNIFFITRACKIHLFVGVFCAEKRHFSIVFLVFAPYRTVSIKFLL